jgi:chromosomal replication initiation ATPase DnaA
MSTNELLYSIMLRQEGIPRGMSIIDAVCIVCECDESDLKDRTRIGFITEARQIAMYFYLKNGEGPTVSASVFNRDHSTAIHAEKKIMSLYGQKSERKLTEMVDKISDLTGIRI